MSEPSTGAIVGGVIGGVAGIGFIILAALWLAGKKKKSPEAIENAHMRRRASEFLHSGYFSGYDGFDGMSKLEKTKSTVGTVRTTEIKGDMGVADIRAMDTSWGGSNGKIYDTRTVDSWGGWAVPERLPQPGRETWGTQGTRGTGMYFGQGKPF